jgi:TolB-like protein
MTHSRYLLAALAIALSTAACDTPTPFSPAEAVNDDLTAVLASASSDPRGTQSGNSLFDRLAGEISGFGGLYRTDICSVAVVLTNLGNAEQAERLVKSVLEEIVGRSCPNGIRVHAVQGQFTYKDLQYWLSAGQELLRIRGVQGVKVDYQKNRLIVTIEARSVAADVIAALPKVGIPSEAMMFELGATRSR